MRNELGKRAYLVTGGGGAIGAGIAEAILAGGGSVLLLDVHEDQAARNAQALDPTAVSCAAFKCDVTAQSDAQASLARALEVFGRVDGVVNNAGVIRMNTAWETGASEWREHFEVNVTGAFVMAQVVAEHLRGHEGGAIVNVASNCGKVGYPNMAPYNASKAALINMTRSLATEWAPDSINVNAVCPGGVDTPMLHEVAQWLAPRLQTPADDLLEGMGPAQLGRRIDPVEVGRVVAFLLSDDALIIRGQSINVDGGDTPY
jgi:meso-butanediol dehydrogenase/(S,S)-butanediol dehydrogenase/diacetyl reductase